jgi:hypothetical protein
MREVFRESGFAFEETAEGSEIEVELLLVPSPTTPARGIAQCDTNA